MDSQDKSVSSCSFISRDLFGEAPSESEFITNGVLIEEYHENVSCDSQGDQPYESSADRSKQERNEQDEAPVGGFKQYDDKSISEEESTATDDDIFRDIFSNSTTALSSEEFANKILYLTDIVSREREEKYKLKKKIRDLTDENKLQHYDLEEVRDELRQCRKDKEMYQRDVDMLQQEKLYYKSKLDEQIQRGTVDSESQWNLQCENRDLRAKLQEAENEIIQLKHHVSSYKSKLDQKSEEVSQLQAKEQSYYEREDTLRRERDALIRSNAEAIKTVEHLRQTWNSLQEQLRMEVSRKNAQEEHYKKHIQDLEQKVKRSKDENDSLKFAIHNLETLMEEQQLSNENNCQLIESYESQILTLNDEVKHLRELRASLQQQIVDMTEQLQDREEKIEKLQYSNDRLLLRKDELENSLQHVQNRETELLEKMRAESDELIRMKKEREQMQSLRERAVQETERLRIQLQDAECDIKQYEDEIQNLRSLLQNANAEEAKLRVRCANQKHLLDEYEHQLQATSGVQECAIFQQVCEMLDKRFPKLNDSTEQKSVVLQLADKVQQMAEEREEMIAIIDHMKKEMNSKQLKQEQDFDVYDLKDTLEQKQREISHLEALLKQTTEEKSFAERELKSLQKEVEQLRGYDNFSLEKSADDANVDISLTKLSTSFSEKSLQKVLKAFDNLVHEKKILSQKNKELNERLRLTLESKDLDETTTRYLLKESQTIQQQLCGIISAHESVLTEIKQEPSTFLQNENSMSEDKENRDVNQSYLRNMWLHELENNAELRKMVIELYQKKSNQAICHRGTQTFHTDALSNSDKNNESDDLIRLKETVFSLNIKIADLEQNIQDYYVKLEQKEHALSELSESWHNWAISLHELIPQNQRNINDRSFENICSAIYMYIKYAVNKIPSLSNEVNRVEVQNLKMDHLVMNLKAQKSFCIYWIDRSAMYSSVSSTTKQEPMQKLQTYLIALFSIWRLTSLSRKEQELQQKNGKVYYLQAPTHVKTFSFQKEVENAINSALASRLENEIKQKNKVIGQLERKIANLQSCKDKRRQDQIEEDNCDIPYRTLRMMLEEKDAKLNDAKQLIDRLQTQKEKLQLQVTNISKELEKVATAESQQRFSKEAAESRLQMVNKRLEAETKKVDALNKELRSRERKFQDTVAQLLAKTEESFSSEYGSGAGPRQSPRSTPSFNSPPVKEISAAKKKNSPRSSSKKSEDTSRNLKGSSLISQFHQVADSTSSDREKQCSQSVLDNILSSAEANLSKAEKDHSLKGDEVQELRGHIQELKKASQKLKSKTIV
eukprot:jgi/Galph1/289/GphlegSOOS_G5021.1